MPFQKGNKLFKIRGAGTGKPWNCGKPMSEKTKEKIKQANMGNKYSLGKTPWNKGTKGLCMANSGSFKKGHKLGLGRKASDKAKENMSNAHKGKHPSLEARLKQGESLRGRFVGEKNPAWKGGVSRDKHNGDFNYRNWRNNVFKRDNYICCFCHRVGGKLEAHHIKPWAKFVELRLDINNGITLCLDCHHLLHRKKYEIEK